jgi:hypothetical protein
LTHRRRGKNAAESANNLSHNIATRILYLLHGSITAAHKCMCREGIARVGLEVSHEAYEEEREREREFFSLRVWPHLNNGALIGNFRG